MSWTAEFLSASDIQNLIDDGTLKSLYDDSKDHIDNGKNYTAYSADLDDDAKYNHWCNIFLAFANGNIIEDVEQDYYMLAHKLDGSIKLIHAGFYNAANNAWGTAHSLNRFIDGSKAWAFEEPCWTPAVALVKSLGANKWKFHSTIGGAISFRIKTGRGAPNLFDYDSLVQEEIDETKEISLSGDEIPTEDGSTKESVAATMILNKNEIITTINLK